MPSLVEGNNALKIDYFDSIGIQIIPEVESFRSGLMPKNQVLETFKRIDKLPFSNLDIRFSDDTWDFLRQQIYLYLKLNSFSVSTLTVHIVKH